MPGFGTNGEMVNASSTFLLFWSSYCASIGPISGFWIGASLGGIVDGLTLMWAKKMLLLAAALEVSWAQDVDSHRWGQSHLCSKGEGIDHTVGRRLGNLSSWTCLPWSWISFRGAWDCKVGHSWVLKEFEQWHCLRCGNSSVFQKLLFMQSPSLTSTAFILNSSLGKWISFCTTDWAKLSICPQSPRCWGDS